ncbi:hydroxymethylglutaryl-CoA lyase [Paracoccus saliphilus]|nr:hydroxymethylglutaryl-CoA lyase [Paracoccus saliphilus]
MNYDARLDWIAALAEAGLAEIEIGSFVSPTHLPQMADTDRLLEDWRTSVALNTAIPEIIGLVANLRGAERAIAAGVDKITIPVSISETHSRTNLGKSTDEMIAETKRIVQLVRDRTPAIGVEAGLSTAFGCVVEGAMDPGRVVDIAERVIRAGVTSVGLSDTAGSGTPTQVRKLFRQMYNSLGSNVGAAHFHNTRGQGLANVLAALDAGVRTFDSSLAGLGGCPYAPGATGNIVTEDLVFLLEAEGLATGIDLDRLVAARSQLLRGLPGEPLYGYIADAGLPTGFSRSLRSASA